jgi:hypothetical protein
VIIGFVVMAVNEITLSNRPGCAGRFVARVVIVRGSRLIAASGVERVASDLGLLVLLGPAPFSTIMLLPFVGLLGLVGMHLQGFRGTGAKVCRLLVRARSITIAGGEHVALPQPFDIESQDARPLRDGPGDGVIDRMISLVDCPDRCSASEVLSTQKRRYFRCHNSRIIQF